MNGTTDEQEIAAIRIIADELARAIAAAKCHQCGCLQQTVEALSTTPVGRHSGLASKLAEARATFKPKRYDCLGCSVCYPAIAANAFGEAFPKAGARLDLCPIGEPELREGWPPLPGDYRVLRYRAPVAVCTLNSRALDARLDALAPEGLSIVGLMHTENLGIERIIKNTITNPHIRFLLLCGEDTRQAIGHLAGQSLRSLFENGVDQIRFHQLIVHALAPFAKAGRPAATRAHPLVATGENRKGGNLGTGPAVPIQGQTDVDNLASCRASGGSPRSRLRRYEDWCKAR